MSDGRIIGLISGKGGVGKTSMCVNLGIALKQQGAEVTVVDTDFSASNLGVYLGRYDHPVKIQEVLEGDADPSSAIFRHPTGIKVISASNSITDVEPDTSHLRHILEHAASESDYVLVDCPPGLNKTVESIIGACDEIMIVTTPTQTAGINAAQIIEKAKNMRQPVLGTVLNMVEDNPEMELVEREVEMMTESHIMSQIPYDKQMKRSLFENQPLVLYEPLSEAALEIKKLAASLEGKEFDEPSFPKLKRKAKQIKRAFQN
ncbi:MAG: MinD-like ATPase involved in chromosome partitioning or flagellar assembly [Candidatus Nanohaloarchaea archaeon]|jgi:MinD-like ATPase involved in chromosome partitioning or flagellar assembly